MPFALPIVSLFAAVFAILLVPLSLQVGLLRLKTGIWFLDGGHDVLTRRIRAQGNFIEYVPMALIVIALTESSGAPSWLVYVLGVTLLIGRVTHAATILGSGTGPGRAAGMTMTFAVLLTAAGWLLYDTLLA